MMKSKNLNSYKKEIPALNRGRRDVANGAPWRFLRSKIWVSNIDILKKSCKNLGTFSYIIDIFNIVWWNRKIWIAIKRKIPALNRGRRDVANGAPWRFLRSKIWVSNIDILKKSCKNLGTFSYIIDIFNIVWWNRKIWIAIKRKIPALNRGRRDVANGAPWRFLRSKIWVSNIDILKKSCKNLGTFSYIIDIFNIVWWNRKIWIAIKRKIPALNRGRRDVANGAPWRFLRSKIWVSNIDILKKSCKNLGTFSYIIDIFNIVWWNRKIWIAIKRKIPALNRGRRNVANGAPGAF